jgi:hypothetical protein
VVRAIADWWDSVELWLTQLAFPFQVVVAAVVLLPLCWVAAAGVDRVVEFAVERIGVARGAGRVEAGRVEAARGGAGRGGAGRE